MFSKRYIKYALLCLSITALFFALFYILRNNLPDPIIENQYSIIFCLIGFTCFCIAYKQINSNKTHYIIYVVISVLLFFNLGIVLNEIILKDDEHITFNVEMTVSKNDMFQLFYVGPDDVTSEEHSYQKAIKGSLKKQTVSIDLPDTLALKKFRFDLGSDSTLKEIIIETIFVSHNNKFFYLFNSEKGINYFKPNIYVKFDSDKITLTSQNALYDPFIYTDDFQAEYLKLFQTKKHLPFPFLISFFFIFSILIYFLLFSKSREFKTGFYTFASCFFILLLFLPSINETFRFYEDKNLEKRKLAVKPVFDVKNVLDYSKQYEAYYNDNFGFRTLLIQWGGKLRYYLFNTSAVPSKVSVGKDGWLFLNGTQYDITKDLTKSNLYTPEELENSVKEWESRKSDLEKDSISYYKAFWPDKHYIYKEFFALNMLILDKDTIARCDQAINYLKERKSAIHIIDVRAPLLKEKEKHLVYTKHDSHWNSYGGFIAYTELMRNFSVKFPILKSHHILEYNISWNKKIGGDLSEILGVELTEITPQFKLKNDFSKSSTVSIEGYPIKTLIYETKHSSTDLTLLIFRDSFTDAVLLFLKPHFKKIVLIWDTPYSKDLVKKVKPDIVLESYVTRYFR